MTSKAATTVAKPQAHALNSARNSAATAAASAPANQKVAARASKPAAPRKRAAAAQSSPKAQAAQAAKAMADSAAKASKKPAKLRPVLVRDSFTMPETDFALLALLKAKALGASRAAKKSELLRAGLQLLTALDTAALVAALDRLEAVKTGRPKKKG
jgi:hypothetical protein